MLSLIFFPWLLGSSEANEGSSLAKMLILWHVFSILGASSVLHLFFFLFSYVILKYYPIVQLIIIISGHILFFFLFEKERI